MLNARVLPHLILLVLVVSLMGCRAQAEADITTDDGDSSAVRREVAQAEPEPVPSQSLIEEGRERAARVQAAGTPQQEAEALRELQEWQIENQLTYQIKAVTQADNRVVESPSVATVPLRVEVTTYRQKLPVHTFSFIPQSNANLALLGG